VESDQDAVPAAPQSSPDDKAAKLRMAGGLIASRGVA